MLLNEILNEDYIFPIYIYEDILMAIRTICRRASTEIFGYLVGNVFKWNDLKYVVIETQLFVMAATHSQQYTVSQLDGSAGRFEDQFQFLKNRRDKNLRILGWWHSHPLILASKADLETHKFFFPEPYHVLMIIDEEGDKFSFFNTQDSLDGFKEIDYAII